MRLFRFFISSTFTEFDGERATLQREIFPRLTEFGRHKEVLVQPIDLRRGISEAAARERRTVAICLEEIRRCRRLSPSFHFLAMVDSRIGWRPPPAELTPEAVQTARLDQWYRRDDKALPTRALLDPSAPDEVVMEAVEAASLIPPPITHLEIAEGILSQADGRYALVYCCDDGGVDLDTATLTLAINTVQLIGGERVLAVPLKAELLQVWGSDGLEAYQPVSSRWGGAGEAPPRSTGACSPGRVPTTCSAGRPSAKPPPMALPSLTRGFVGADGAGRIDHREVTCGGFAMADRSR